MKGDLLSQAEVESLLTVSVSRGTGGAERVLRYDFRNGERLGAETLRTLRKLHQAYAGNLSEALSALVRTAVSVKLTSVDQLTYGEFLFSLENPTCCNVLRVESFAGQLVLDVNPSVLYPMIDRLLGGGRKETVLARRALTDIELRLVSRITAIALAEWKRAWKDVLPLDAVVERVESNPQAVQIVPAEETVVVVSCEIALGESRGMMNLCLPLTALGHIASELLASEADEAADSQTTSPHAEQMGRNLRGSSVEMVVVLAETRITTQQLMSLRPGDVISTDKRVQSPLAVNVEGVTKFSARPGAYKGHKAVSIQQTIEPPAEA